MSPSAASPGLHNVRETPVPVKLSIHGAFPEWLSGWLYRTGPGTFDLPGRDGLGGPSVSMHHWFDGLGMNHRFDIRGHNDIWYSSKKATDELRDRTSKEGTYPPTDSLSFAQRPDPCEQIFQKFFTEFQPTKKDRSSPASENISVTLSANMPGFSDSSSHSGTRSNANSPGNLVAKSDNSFLQILDPATLAPLKMTSYRDLDKRLSGGTASAHSSIDPNSGDFYNVFLKFGPSPTYLVFCIRNQGIQKGKVEILAEIVDAPAAYLHSSFMTQKYIVVGIWQADYEMGGLAIVQNKNMVDSIKPWNAKRPVFFYVVDRQKGGVVAKYQSAASFFAFHSINAFDEGDDVVLDVCVYEDNEILRAFYLDRMRDLVEVDKTPLAAARRYRLQDVGGIAEKNLQSIPEAKIEFERPRQSENIELPIICPRLSTRPYRFAYGISKSTKKGSEKTFADQIIKIDFSSKNSKPQMWHAGPDSTPGEPIFVQRPGSTEEDDGILLTVVLDGKSEKSNLVAVDPKNMRETGRAVMEYPFPLGFHGVFTSALLTQREPSRL